MSRVREKIIVTGASGFVGMNLCEHLMQKNQIESLSLRNEGFQVPNNALAVIHLAGKAHDLKNSSDPEAYFRINTRLTEMLFDSFLQSTARDFIYFSSVKAVADTVDGILGESAVPNPQTPYGISKQKAETYLLNQKMPAGKRLFILRPCMIHGPGNKGNLNLLYKVVKKGIPYPLAAFENRRSFLSIKNLVFIIEQIIADNDIKGGVYNVADDEALSTNEVIEIIGNAANIRAKLWSVAPKIIKTLARLGDKLYMPLNTERLKKLTESYEVSNHKIKLAMKIQNLPQSSREGLFDTIKSFNKK